MLQSPFGSVDKRVMDIFVVLNAIHIDGHAFDPLFSDGDTALSRTVRKALSLAPGGRCFLFLPVCYVDVASRHLRKKGLNAVVFVQRQQWDTDAFLQALDEAASSLPSPAEGALQLFYHLYADAPLFDESLALRMLHNHEHYYATYSFADGYPRFFAPEIVSVSAIGQIRELYRSSHSSGKDVPLSDSILFDLIQKDINAFDIETEIAPDDLRLLRVDLVARGKERTLLLKHIIDAGGEVDPIPEILVRQPALLRTVPAFIYIQIHSACPQRCSWCPYPKAPSKAIDRNESMSPEALASILDQVVELSEEAVIGLSLWGEPALHPDIQTMVGKVISRPGLSAMIETSGVGWNLSVLDAIAALETATERIEWIVSLDAFEVDSYRRFRGEGMEEALATVRALAERFPGHVRVQAVRTKENEAELEQFYRFWKKQNVEVIIQKYDNFAGALEERKVTDLSPVVRFPCWHLKRDLHIFLDGSVPLCKEIIPGSESIDQGTLLGNVFEEPLKDIWKRGEERYLAHIRQEWGYPCEGCDEYYTFNF